MVDQAMKYPLSLPCLKKISSRTCCQWNQLGLPIFQTKKGGIKVPCHNLVRVFVNQNLDNQILPNIEMSTIGIKGLKIDKKTRSKENFRELHHRAIIKLGEEGTWKPSRIQHCDNSTKSIIHVIEKETHTNLETISNIFKRVVSHFNFLD